MNAYMLDASTPSINRERLDELKQILGEEFPRLLDIYREDATRRLELLRQAINRGDAAEVQKIAHSMKSASANMALERMAGWAWKLEELGRAGVLAMATQVLEELSSEYAAIEPVLVAELKNSA